MRSAVELERSRLGRVLRSNAPEILLGAAVLCSGVLLVALTSQMTWRHDDWFVLFSGQDWSVHSLMVPQYEHITIARNVIYKTLLAAFGMDSQIPFSVVAISVFLLSTVLLFVYLRRRVDDWLALIAATVILFLGAAWEDLLWPIQIVHFGAMACGLGMLLALEREDRFGDRLACGLLAGSLSFFTLGFVFVAGATVDIALRRDVWRRRVYIVAIPLLLYALWWIGWGHTAANSISLHDFGSAPLFMLDAIAAGIASLLGLAGATSVPTVQGSLDWGRPLLPVVLLIAVWRLQRLERVPRSLWIVAAIGFSSWFLGGLAQQLGRPPDASRYQYPSAIFILLIAAELMRGVRVGRNALIAISVVGVAAVMGNVTELSDQYKIRRGQSQQEKAAFAAMEIAKDREPAVFDLGGDDPAFDLFVSQTLPYNGVTPGPTPGTGVYRIKAGGYLRTVDEFGSPAYSPGELASSPDAARQVADRVLAAALGIKLARTNARASPRAGPRPTLIGPPEALAGSNSHCLHLNVSGTSPPLLDLPPGGAVLASGTGRGFEVRLRRFASSVLPVDLGMLPAHAAAVIDIPPDRSAEPWKLSLDGSGRVDVCGRPHGQS